MFSLPTLLLLTLSTLASSSPTFHNPRAALTTTDDLNTINADILALTEALNTYQGGLVEALPIHQASDKLIADLQAAAAGPAVFADDAESQAALTLAKDTLAPNVEASSSALISKKELFDAAGATSLVKTSLSTISSASSDYGKKLLANNESFASGGGTDAQARIDASLSGAVAAYA